MARLTKATGIWLSIADLEKHVFVSSLTWERLRTQSCRIGWAVLDLTNNYQQLPTLYDNSLEKQNETNSANSWLHIEE